MLIRTPTLDAGRIESWIRDGAESLSPANGAETSRSGTAEGQWHAGFDFKKARQALQRARAKTALRTIKPLRRLRTNQAAVNESVIDALSALLAVNKSMAAEVAALATEVAELRGRLAGRSPQKHS